MTSVGESKIGADQALNIADLPKERRDVYEYYDLRFDKNGCPMKAMEDKLVFHPILPPYLIVDYLRLYKSTGDQNFLNKAVSIADIALTHGKAVSTTFQFIYPHESGLTEFPQDFYSALTQAWYIKALCQLNTYANGKYNHVLKRLFSSLLLPAEASGVLLEKEYGWVVEEYPNSPPLYTLNGWLTVLRWVIQSHNALKEIGIDPKFFLDKNFDAVEKLLPLYDAGFCLNSRYQLAGFSRLKFVTDRPAGLACKSFEIDIPNEGVFKSANKTNSKSRWLNYIEKTNERSIQFNVVLSLISAPKPNTFRAIIRSDSDCEATLFQAQGEYNPGLSGMPTQSWNAIESYALTAGIGTQITSNIPFDSENMFAYPTNFKKSIRGMKFNGYHFVHIIDLAEIYAFCKRDIFKEYCLMWLSYVEKWKDLELLKNYSKDSHIYGDYSNLRSIVLDMLRS